MNNKEFIKKSKEVLGLDAKSTANDFYVELLNKIDELQIEINVLKKKWATIKVKNKQEK